MASPVLALLALLTSAMAEPPEYPRKTDGARPPFLERLKAEVPALKHERGKRWPMILWECVSFEPQPPEVYKVLLDRGIAQHLRLEEAMIPAAQAIQKAGSPVIFMQGAGGPWPYNQANAWAHQYEEGYQPQSPKDWWPSWQACVGVFEGWQVQADRIRALMRKCREAGITVDAVWMDWEGEPSSSGGQQGWENARHCRRCRATLPADVLRDAAAWPAYCERLSNDLIGCYLAAPVREVFPACSVTNWMAVVSTPDRPVRGWGNHKVRPVVPALLTATNPVAYGNDVFWQFWNAEWPLERRSVDHFYLHLLLRQVSDDAANKLHYAPGMDTVPWVARWCPDRGDEGIPMISREAYREALRHLWLRGVDGMQIFNATRQGYEDIVFAEVADAVSVFDEMLAYTRLLDGGRPLCFDVPGLQPEGLLWSGMATEEEAVVRLIQLGERAAKVQVEPWPGLAVEMETTADGATYWMARKGADIQVERK
ncbi:MAG: hypothetical protein HYU36_08235 [Planctomycetes bacterium]|nr:hypothetical protein [Planctomycetota bacterium]